MNEPNPAVSVVMPVGSVDETLHSAVDSVVAQETSFSFELVLSVNTKEQLDLGAIAESGRVRLVDASSRRGAAHARNVGASHAAAPILAFCDSDDVAEAGWLASLVDGLQGYGAVSGAVSDERFAPVGGLAWRPAMTSQGLPTFLDVPYVLSGNLAIFREAFEAVGGFDTTLTRCEDIALGWALLRTGRSIGFVPEAVISYRPRAGVMRMVHQHYLYGRGMSEVLMRHGVPDGFGRTSGLRSLVKPNGQPTSRRTAVGSLRRGSIATGWLTGLVWEGLRPTRDEPAVQP